MWAMLLLPMGVMVVVMDTIKLIMGVGVVLRGNDDDGDGGCVC